MKIELTRRLNTRFGQVMPDIGLVKQVEGLSKAITPTLDRIDLDTERITNLLQPLPYRGTADTQQPTQLLARMKPPVGKRTDEISFCLHNPGASVPCDCV